MAYKLGSNSNSGAYNGMQNSGLISPDQSVFNDGDPKEKVKVKVNKRTGEKKIKTKKVLADGTKIKSKEIQGPITYTVSEANSISANVQAEVKPTVSYFGPKVDFKPPSVENGNSEQGDSKPFVKPIRTRKEAFENRGEEFKNMDFPEYNQYINKWNKENPPKSNPGKKDDGESVVLPGRRAVRLDYNSAGNLNIQGVKTITPSTYSSYEQKIKSPNDKNPPSKPPTGGSSTGDGLCTAANPDSCNAFSEKDGGEGEMMNNILGRGDKKKQAERNAAGDARKRKNAAQKTIASNSRTFKKQGRKELKADQKAFAREMGAETRDERKQLKTREKGQRVEFKKQTNDRFKTAENRKDKNARERFRKANKTLKSNATVGDKLRKGGAKLATNLLGKGKQEQRATAGRSTAAKNNRNILKNKDLAIIKASF
tara:strand:- start:309 stop:1589 length:1281 start_codon:yes stop_codon:yes gene_type:complete